MASGPRDCACPSQPSARSLSGPAPDGSSATTPSAGRGRKRTIWQRESTVAGRARAWLRIRMITVRPGGSSSVLRNACGAAPVMVSASSTMKTLHGASAGRSAAILSSSRILSTRIAGVPLGLLAGGVGPTRCTSGCMPRSARPAAAPPSGATSALAKARAVVRRPTPWGPMNAHAWATRPLSRARRSMSTASSCPRIASSATRRLMPLEPLEPLAHGAHAGGMQRVLGLRGVQHDEATLLGPRDLEIAVAHAAMEGEIHLLESIEGAIADPPHALGGIEVEEQGQIGHHPTRGESIEIANGLEVHAAAETLIGQGGVGVAVGDDDGAAAQSGTDHLRDVLLPRRHEEKSLGEGGGRNAFHLEEAANGRAERGAIGLARENDLAPLAAEPIGEEATVGGLAGAFHTLEGDEEPTHGATLTH